MAMGMTYDEYWHGDPYICKFTRLADKKKRERENFGYWLQGIYFYNALLDVSPMVNIFDKNRKPVDYLLEPIDLYKPDEETIKERNNKIQQKGIENMKQWALAVNAKKKREAAKNG